MPNSSRARAHARRIAFAISGDFDDLLGNNVRDGIGTIREPKQAQCGLIASRHAANVLRSEGGFLQETMDRHFGRRPPTD